MFGVRIQPVFAGIIRRWDSMRAKKWEMGRSEIEGRGIKLLREWLSPQQLIQFNRSGYFEVNGCATGKRYRIRYGYATNIHELDNWGRPRAGWCFVPSQQLVPGDVMLAQKIALETDELGALAVAKLFRPTWH
jgi:hypothetical protein